MAQWCSRWWEPEGHQGHQGLPAHPGPKELMGSQVILEKMALPVIAVMVSQDPEDLQDLLDLLDPLD
ncbi:hypothetical protein JZ751_027892 [Albula glossodonta]|uniref:Uncharacterized protein n=1 Tax=Albula glossodonta TaxID=121402 RepID=A0A8T2PB43_9TELE|nr:hypothetical protein JZ751_027892 [Albula glossodonta]